MTNPINNREYTEVPSEIPNNFSELLPVVTPVLYDILIPILLIGLYRTRKRVKDLLKGTTLGVVNTLPLETAIISILNQLLGATRAEKIELGMFHNGSVSSAGYHFQKLSFTHTLYSDHQLSDKPETFNTYPLSQFHTVLSIPGIASHWKPYEGSYWLLLASGNVNLGILKLSYVTQPDLESLAKSTHYAHKLVKVIIEKNEAVSKR